MQTGKLLDYFRKPRWANKPAADGKPHSILAADKPTEDPAQAGDAEARQILVDHPGISGATLLNTLKSKGAKVVKQTESMAEGGPGSGRYPKGSGDSEKKTKQSPRIKKQPWDASTKDTPEYDVRKAQQKVDKIRAEIDRLKAEYKKRFGVEYKKKEADSSSANAQALRAQESSHAIRESNILFRSTFMEAAASDNGIGHTKFSVVLLQEGLGNLKDGYFYSRPALESAIQVFEGKKIYADHPSQIEEQTRPERSVKDVLGHFENVHLETNKAGQAMLVAEVVILGDEPYRWARALMRHSVEYAKKYPDKDFVGLSINASGEAEARKLSQVLEEAAADPVLVKLRSAQASGMETVKYVTAIREAVSCDLVTEAGAGGKVLDMIEKQKPMQEGGPGSGRYPAGSGKNPSEDDNVGVKVSDKELKSKFGTTSWSKYGGHPKKIEEFETKLKKHGFKPYTSDSADKPDDSQSSRNKVYKDKNGNVAVIRRSYGQTKHQNYFSFNAYPAGSKDANHYLGKKNNKESWHARAEGAFKKMTEGGPGSGRYPAGSSGNSDNPAQAGISAAKADARKREELKDPAQAGINAAKKDRIERMKKRQAKLGQNSVAQRADQKKSDAIKKGIHNSKTAAAASAELKKDSKRRADERRKKNKESEAKEAQESLKLKEGESIVEKKQETVEAAAPADAQGPAALSAEAAPVEQAPAAGQHDDEAQDRELIKKMIAEYLGADEIDNEEIREMCKEAYEAYKEMGYQEDEALKAAGQALKLAKHMAEKAEAEEEQHVDVVVDGEHTDIEQEEPEAEEPEGEEEEEEEAPAKEAAAIEESNEIMTLKAEIAALKEGYKQIEIEKHLDKTLRESGLPRSATAVFRENLGTVKSVKEIDEKFKLFVESYKAARGSVTAGLPFVLQSEKHGDVKTNLSFSDCLK